MHSRFAFVILAILFLSAFGKAQDSRTNPPIVSLVQLLSSPEKFDGKHIAVLGFLTIGQENNYLYLSKNDYDNALPNSIWVENQFAAIWKLHGQPQTVKAPPEGGAFTGDTRI
jgi:hypothetical protein